MYIFRRKKSLTEQSQRKISHHLRKIDKALERLHQMETEVRT